VAKQYCQPLTLLTSQKYTHQYNQYLKDRQCAAAVNSRLERNVSFPAKHSTASPENKTTHDQARAACWQIRCRVKDSGRP
jgi:hypothetical protein